MTEVIHYKNRFGKQMVIATEIRKCPSPESKEYYQRYATGQVKPYYPVPAIIIDTTFRPMGLALWRCYDGKDGNRYTIERQWFKYRIDFH